MISKRLATSAWGDFIGSFRRHQDCIDPVTVVPALRLGDRPTYYRGTRAGDGARAVHGPQLARRFDTRVRPSPRLHLPSRSSFSPSVLAAQGLATTRPWGTGASWEQIPAEQFADAAVEIGLGPNLMAAPPCSRGCAARDAGVGSTRSQTCNGYGSTRLLVSQPAVFLAFSSSAWAARRISSTESSSSGTSRCSSCARFWSSSPPAIICNPADPDRCLAWGSPHRCAPGAG